MDIGDIRILCLFSKDSLLTLKRYSLDLREYHIDKFQGVSTQISMTIHEDLTGTGNLAKSFGIPKDFCLECNRYPTWPFPEGLRSDLPVPLPKGLRVKGVHNSMKCTAIRSLHHQSSKQEIDIYSCKTSGFSSRIIKINCYPMLIFCRFKSMVLAIHTALQKKRYPSHFDKDVNCLSMNKSITNTKLYLDWVIEQKNYSYLLTMMDLQQIV